MKKTLLFSAILAFLVTIITTVGILNFYNPTDQKSVKIEHITSTPAAQAVYRTNEEGKFIPLDFSKVAEDVMDAVVHIKSTQTYNNSATYQKAPNPFGDSFGPNDLFQEFFGPRNFQQRTPRKQRSPQVKMGQGSGVIISEDGYIITNNHVIADADDLEVTLHDNRTYKAKIVGTDPTTDLALIQIKEKALPTLPLVNSDNVKVGQWVMAVGNPFNLNSTVTAGIVSAKGRNINILREQFAVESFIQTDAAINPGNSGGALVNLEGGLIGINTAIASPTGAYSGYGFAVPTNIVSKVVEDLIKYGVVQRGVLGIMIRTVDGNLQKDKDLAVVSGAYVDSLLENSAAGKAGIQSGDVVININDLPIESSPKLQEVIARHRPGDNILVTVDRDGVEKTFEVTLNNRKGNTNIVKKEYKEVLSILGANLETIDKATAKKLDLKGGVKIAELYAGKLRKQTDIRPGFIITKVDGQTIKTMEELIKKLDGKKGGVMLEGVYEDIPGEFYYAFGL